MKQQPGPVNSQSQCSDKLLQIHLYPDWQSALSVAGHNVNIFAAISSALVILSDEEYEVRGGRIPRCATAARLDGSMTLKHVCAIVRLRPDDARPHWGVSARRRLNGLRLSMAFRLPSCPAPMAFGGSTICLRLPMSVALLNFRRLEDSRGTRRVNLGHQTALAC